MEMSKREISEILGRSLDAIQVKANRMGLKKSPYFCDYHYFDVIDTEEKAYWLGFLTADGWINKSEKTNAGVTGIELQYGDIGHLKKFNKSISGNYQITDRWRTCSISTKNPDKLNHMCVIRVFSLVMYESLYNLGFSNKSFSISFITASKSLYEDLLEILENIPVRVSSNIFVNEFGTTIYRPEIYRLDDKINFLDWIYQDCSIYLDRKYKKYLKVKKHYETTESLAI